jgi:hypothetical protein
MSKKSKFSLKNLSGNVLLVCGLVATLCTTWTQVKDTFLTAAPVKMEAPAPAPAPAPVYVAPITEKLCIEIPPEVRFPMRSASRNISSLLIPPEPVKPLVLKPVEKETIAILQAETQSAPPAPKSYLWIFILIASIAAIIGGYYLREKIQHTTVA